MKEFLGRTRVAGVVDGEDMAVNATVARNDCKMTEKTTPETVSWFEIRTGCGADLLLPVDSIRHRTTPSQTFLPWPPGNRWT